MWKAPWWSALMSNPLALKSPEALGAAAAVATAAGLAILYSAMTSRASAAEGECVCVWDV